MNPKVCKNCGRVMEKDLDTDRWACVCGNEENIYYRREDDY